MKDKTWHGVRVPWSYLVASHGEATLRDWVQRLRFFRFCRAVPGGHAADGDSLRLALKDDAGPQRLITDISRIDRAGRSLIDDIPVNYSYGEGVVWLSLSGAGGDVYSVTAEDVENALVIEHKIESIAACIIDPPVAGPYCVSPEFWPEFWQVA